MGSVEKLKREDLQKPSNLIPLFEDLRNYLAGSAVGITRDETIAKEIIDLLFCKVYDELNTPLGAHVSFYVRADQTEEEVSNRIKDLYNKVKSYYSEVFDEKDTIELDPKSIKYIVKNLQDLCLTEAERDVIRQAFEVFIGPALRGSEGQFFTPRNVARLCTDILDPKPGERIIDPACGSGGFLVVAMDHVLKRADADRKDEVHNEEITGSFVGIDKDRFLARVSRAYMAILGDGGKNIFSENSLKHPNQWDSDTRDRVELEKFDVLLTNPPFGSKIKIEDEEILSQYELGHRWEKSENGLKKTDNLKQRQPPQILFIERSLQFLREEGRMAIVLPEGVLGNPNQQYLRKFIRENAKILAVIDAPPETFQPSTHTKTCILFLEKNSEPDSNYPVFMAIAKKCGHDSRGKPVYKMDDKGNILHDENGEKMVDDDFPIIAQNYQKVKKQKKVEFNSNGFRVDISNIEEDIFVPRLYDPSITRDLDRLSRKHNLKSLTELEEEGIISIFKGRGVRKRFYGTGDVPYIRTSDIANWEINTDHTHKVSEEIFERFKQDLRKNDILIIKDGTYLIGNTCILSEEDTKILIQSHFDVIRSLNKRKLNPFLLVYLLNTPIVQKQIYAKTITQSTISTIGGRLYDVVLPIPKDSNVRDLIIKKMKRILKKRREAKKEIGKITQKRIKEFEKEVSE